jgi:hypothetical protein
VSPPARPRSWRRLILPTAPVLVVALVALALDSRLATSAALLVAAVGVAASLGLRANGRPWPAELAPVPVLVALGVLAVETPISPLPELLVGATGVAFVAWLADDPWRPPAGAARGALVWALPGFGVGIAWASTFLLPRSAASLGVAGGLLAAAIIALAYLVSRPDLFDRGDATTI